MSEKREHRIEKDSMGDVNVPAKAYYGAQTQRAVENFPISGQPLPGRLIAALGLVTPWLAALERGNPPISRDEARVRLHSKDDPLLQATGARSWFALDRQTTGIWGLSEENGVHEISVGRPLETHGWGQDESKRIQFLPGTAVDDVIDCLGYIIQVGFV